MAQTRKKGHAGPQVFLAEQQPKGGSNAEEVRLAHGSATNREPQGWFKRGASPVDAGRIQPPSRMGKVAQTRTRGGSDAAQGWLRRGARVARTRHKGGSNAEQGWLGRGTHSVSRTVRRQPPDQLDEFRRGRPLGVARYVRPVAWALPAGDCSGRDRPALRERHVRNEKVPHGTAQVHRSGRPCRTARGRRGNGRPSLCSRSSWAM